MYSTELVLRTSSANDQFDDDDLKLISKERVSLMAVLFAGVGLLWFLGWLFTL